MLKLHEEDAADWDLEDPTFLPQLLLEIGVVLDRWRAGHPASIAVQGALAAAAEDLRAALYAEP